MSDPAPTRALARIVAAHRGRGPGAPDLSGPLKTGLTRAIRRAGLPFANLLPEVADADVIANATLADALDALPEHGLLAAIEDGEGRRGLIGLGPGLVDALIEVQATGRVEETDLPPRKVTKIDEALCRDFIDLTLGGFAKEVAGETARDWPDRMSFGSRITDRAQLNLLMPEAGYHVVLAKVTAAGRKGGAVGLVLPVDAALARRRSAAATPAAPRDAAEWSARMLEALGAAPIHLDAVLTRVTLPLGRVQGLTEGDLVPFAPGDLQAVTLEGSGDHVFARGALGQLGGHRAVRVDVSGSGAGRGPKGSRPAAEVGAGTPDGGVVSGSQVDPQAAMKAHAGPAPMAGQPPGGPMGQAGAAGVQAPPPMPGPVPGFDPDAPMAGFDTDTPMDGFGTGAAAPAFDPDAPIG